MSASDLATRAADEVRALHVFFVDWLTGRAAAGDGAAAGALGAGGAAGSGDWNGNTAGAGRQSAKPARQIRSVGLRWPCATKVRISMSDNGPCCLPSRAMYHWMSGCWPVMEYSCHLGCTA